MMTSSPGSISACRQLYRACFAAGAHQDLVGFEVQLVVAVELVRDGGAQGRRAADRGVAGLTVADGLDCRVADVFRGVEIRFPGAPINDFLPRRAEAARSRGDGQRCGRLATSDPFRKGAFHGKVRWRVVYRTSTRYTGYFSPKSDRNVVRIRP